MGKTGKTIGLSAREQAVLKRMALGQTYAGIAASLGLSPHTIDCYIRRIYTKLGVHSKAQAIVWHCKNSFK